ncbi:MAG: stress response translation initiation inhibitor YciH [Desulfobacter sp.]|nr:stress response translation initiation inhibitor YciH [Desulfobacter sp.]WDP84917.1 MAG: stress response translation initiation inhibitor YciH [Desulfobacter sp.]
MKKKDFNSRLVYSTDLGRICPDCNQPSKACICKKTKAHTNLEKEEKITVERSTKGRKGKGVTLIKGLALEGPALKALAKQLKQKCSTGGTVKNNVIELQGNHREVLVGFLKSLGHKAVKAGG